MPLMITLPQEIENFVIKTAHKQRIQNYKNDIKLIREGKMKMYSAEEVFGEVRKMIDEI